MFLFNMPGNKPLSPTKVAQIVVLRKEGESFRQIAKKLSILKSAAERGNKLFMNSGQYQHKKPSGRPSKLTDRVIRLIKRMCYINPQISYNEIRLSLLDHNTVLSSGSIIQIIRQKTSLRCYKPAKKPLLTVAMMKKRKAWCKKYRNWTVSDWKMVMWSDETIIRQFSSYRPFVRRPPNTRFHPKYILPTVRHPMSLMVWRCMSFNGRGECIF